MIVAAVAAGWLLVGLVAAGLAGRVLAARARDTTAPVPPSDEVREAERVTPTARG